MSKQIELMLVNKRRALGLLLAWAVLLVAGVEGLASLVGTSWYLVGMISGIGGLSGLFWVIRKAARQPHTVTIATDQLTVLNQANGQVKVVPFAAVKNCSNVWGRGNGTLQLRMQSGARISLTATNELDRFGILVHAVRVAIEQYQLNNIIKAQRPL